MGRSFTEEEKKHLEQQMYEVGRKCLITYGVQRTKIEDITREVGISKGSFYLFFDSKEEFFFRIVNQEHEKLENDLMIKLSKPGSKIEKIKAFFL